MLLRRAETRIKIVLKDVFFPVHNLLLLCFITVRSTRIKHQENVTRILEPIILERRICIHLWTANVMIAR